MTGVIWLVQLVYYPSPRAWREEHFVEWERRNTRRTGLVVGPAMLVEALSLAVLLFMTSGSRRSWLIVSAVLLALIWLSTLLIQAPCHARLERERRGGDVELLISTNWLRTLLWSLRLLILAAVLIAGPPAGMR